MLTCDPTGNLVHAEKLVRDGAVWQGTPIAHEQEFLASLDPWFRPVDLQTGPDGALYVVDMCRAVIEHPDFMPTELKSRADLRWGRGAGRIWRVASATYDSVHLRNEATDAVSCIADWEAMPLDSEESCRRLEQGLRSPNPWLQDQLTRLTRERIRNADAPGVSPARLVGLLRDLVDDSRANEATRIRAFRLLTCEEGGTLGDAIDQPAINRWLVSDSGPVRSDVLRWLRDANQVETIEPSTWEQLVQSTDGEVRLQTSLTLGQCRLPERASWLSQLYRQGSGRFEREGVLLGATGVEAKVVLALQPSERSDLLTLDEDEALVALIAIAARTADASTRAELFSWLRQCFPRCEPTFGIQLLDRFFAEAGYGEELRRGSLPTECDLVSREWWRALSTVFDSAITDEGEAEPVRAAAIGFVLRYGPSVRDEERQQALIAILLAPESTTIKLAAVGVLPQLDTAEEWGPIWETFATQNPAVRTAIAQAASATVPGRATLMTALESGQAEAALLTPVVARRLAEGETELAERLRAYQEGLAASRAAIDFASYREALTAEHDPRRGQQLFGKHCANCHRIGDLGTDIGPDISDSRVKEPAQLLEDILNPNGSIDANFVAYAAETIDGGSFVGVLVSETGQSVTLKTNEGKVLTLARDELVSFASTGRSLMPERLDQSLAPDELASIIAFVKRWRYLDEGVPGVEEKKESPDTDSR
ncbi:MAG: c-type cytochrome [Pirellulaceae bacterium]